MVNGGQAIVLTVLGALLGAILSPAIERLFRGRDQETQEKHTLARGLTLLCSANATWVMSMIVFEYARQTPLGVTVAILLYGLTVVFFIGSYTQLNHAGDASHQRWAAFVIPLLLGNALWVGGEAFEGVLCLFAADESPQLWGKYVFLGMAVLSFAWGVCILPLKHRQQAYLTASRRRRARPPEAKLIYMKGGEIMTVMPIADADMANQNRNRFIRKENNRNGINHGVQKSLEISRL